MSLPLLLPHGPWLEPAYHGGQVWGDVTIIVQRWDGTLYRWAGDELDAANIPCDLVYTTSMPGGFKTCTCTLFRSLQTPAPEGLFDEVTILGPGGQVYWEGRLQAMPSSTADGGRINPAAVGHSAALEDRHDVQGVWIDRDLAQWGALPTARERQLAGFNWHIIPGSTAWDDATGSSAGPTLRLWREKGQGAWTSNAGRPLMTVAYNSGGPEIAGLEARVRRPQDVTYSGWRLQFEWSSQPSLLSPAVALNAAGAALTNGAHLGGALGNGARAAEINLLYEVAPGGNNEAEYGLHLAEVAVYGQLDQTRVARTDSLFYGPGQGPQGIPADSVIRDSVARWAPSLRVDDESVQRTDYLMPHLVQREPSTLASLIELCNRFHWWDWAVWEDRRFWYHQRFGGQSRTWLVSTDDGSVLDMEGETTDVIWTGVVVSYRDFAGVTHTIGPPGSTAESTDPRLASSDPDNPATLHGITRTGHFSLSEPVNREGAVLCGMGWLDAQSQATRRGSCTVVGSVLDEHGNEHPVDMVRGGDQLWVIDRPDDPPRRIIETSMARNGRANTLTLDNTAQTLEALLERMEASFVGVI